MYIKKLNVNNYIPYIGGTNRCNRIPKVTPSMKGPLYWKTPSFISSLYKSKAASNTRIPGINIFKSLTINSCINKYTNTKLPEINDKSISNKPYILGSVKYVKKIHNITKKFGNRSALSAIMIDVDKNGNDLDNNKPDNISRFHILVSSLLYKIGYVDRQTHYFRNKLNRVPKTLEELINLNKTLQINKRWILLSIQNSIYHIQGVCGEYNLKFVSYDGFCEAVYNKKGILLNESNDPINMGSYNYAAGIPNIHAHAIFDVSPYIKWGNTASSLQKGKDAIFKGVYLALINYKEHAANVYVYRQNLFGMQQGRVE